ncbi:MAG: 16S rRNA (guanine(527)-N(7))-methyltransferase RsmG [Nitrospina sp.]|jgi:16S rRNA (guanine527-N7)-methyltransferase|nr:16S rRNA (guanine(527)-N(7))-methyltransferase RsmG [Nitrospina sp.]
MNIKKILQDPRLDLSPDAPPEQIELQIQSYLDLLVKWNQKINLTSEKLPQDILSRHVFDSLQYVRVLSVTDRLMDIGSGAGFPGIPIKIVYPRTTAVLVESQRKRCSFLEAAAHKLNLENTTVINERAENISIPSKIDTVIFRAVSDIKSCLSLAVRFLRIDGRVVLKKDPEEKIKINQTLDNFLLQQEVVVTGFNNKKSSLLVFKKYAS